MKILDAAATFVAAILGLACMSWAGWTPVFSWAVPEFPVYMATILVSLPVGVIVGKLTSEPLAKKSLAATILAILLAILVTAGIGFGEEAIRQVIVSGISTVSSPLFAVTAFNVIFALFHYGGKGKNNRRAMGSAFVLGAVFTGIGLYSLPLAMVGHAVFDFGTFLGAMAS